EREIPGAADGGEPIVLPERDPGRVVAAVLQPLEPLQQEVLTWPVADVADDSAHRRNLPLEREMPGCSPRRAVAASQPSSRVTRARMVPQAASASAAVSASARMRI